MRSIRLHQTADSPRHQLVAWLFFSVGLMFFSAFFSTALAATVNGVRMWAGPDNTRLVFDISGPVDHKIFMLGSPNRIVVDMQNTRLRNQPAGLNFGDGVVTDIRSGERNGNDLRMVLDIKGKVRPKSFLLKPTKQYGHRLVIDLQDARVTDLAPLATLTNLKKLNLINNPVTDEEVAKLQKALPNCEILY